MTTYSITLRASKAGSIGTKYCETRHYQITADTREDAENQARMKAYDEGLEHTLITKAVQS